MVDDLDRAEDLAESLSVLFTVLTELKAKHPRVTIVLTAQRSIRARPRYADALDEALATIRRRRELAGLDELEEGEEASPPSGEARRKPAA